MKNGNLHENAPVLLISCCVLLCGTILSALANIQLKLDAVRKRDPHVSIAYDRRYFLLGILLSVAAGSADMVVVGFVPLSVRACFSSLSIPISVILARIILGEVVRSRQMIGITITVFGCIFGILCANHNADISTHRDIFTSMDFDRAALLALITVPVLVMSFTAFNTSTITTSSRMFSLFSCAYATSFVAACASILSKALSELIYKNGVTHHSVWLMLIGCASTCILQMGLMSSMMGKFDAIVCVPPYQILHSAWLAVFSSIIFFEHLANSFGFSISLSISAVGIWQIAVQNNAKEERFEDEPLLVVQSGKFLMH